MSNIITYFKRLFDKRLVDDDIPKLTFKERILALKNLPEFLKLIWKAQPILSLLNILLRIIRSTLPLAILYIGKLIIDEVIILYNSYGPVDTSTIINYVIIEFILIGVSDLLNRAISLLDSILGDLVSNHTSVLIMEHANRLDLSQFEDSKFYDKMERARRQTSARVTLLSLALGQIQSVLTILFLMAGLITFNPYLIILIVLSVIPSFITESHFNVKSYSLSHSWTPQRRELDYLRYIGASNETKKEIKIYGLSPFLTNRFKALSDRYFQMNKHLAINRALWGTSLNIFGSVAYYAAYILIIYQTISREISIGDMTFLAGSFQRLRSLSEEFLGRFSEIIESSLYLKDLFEFFKIGSELKSPPLPLAFPSRIKSGIIFDSVSFKYSNSDEFAVKGVSFEIKPGEAIALVGENGSGKTTLVKLLARLYDPTDGAIVIDGKDLKEYDLSELQNQIGVIFQDYLQYQMTASLNISVGSIGDLDNHSKVHDSARKSLADTVISKLPKGYDQMLGKRFRGGVDLSKGEWQKVALSRVYMRDSSILILDEPTASLDARAEHEIFLRFSELTKGKTSVLISHRFSTVRIADKIIVLREGKLIEMGSHIELMNKKGYYAELFNLQAKGYL